jgi:hypothetical protein
MLRDFGYIVVLALDEKQEAEYGWTLEVNNDSPGLY